VPNGASTYTFSGGSAIVNPTSTTSYSVTGTSSAGCVASNTAVSTVTVKPSPNVTAIAIFPTTCEGGISILLASGAITYTWNTGSTINPLIGTPTITTTYTVTGKSLNGCTDQAVITQTVQDCFGRNAQDEEDQTLNTEEVTGFNDHLFEGNKSIRIYPNPAFNEVSVNLQLTGKKTSVAIYNVVGQLIYESLIQKEKTQIDLNGFANGVYLVKITENGKLIKQERLIKTE
jgi:hypothetical protein